MPPESPSSPDAPADAHDLLQHPVRKGIVDWVDAHPGGHLGEMVRALHLGWGNARHHIGRMAAAGLLVQEQESNRVHLFLPGQVPSEDRRLFSVLEHDCLRGVVGVVHDHPGINQRSLAGELGISPTAARKHARRLVEEGILAATRDGKQVHYDLAMTLPHRILEDDIRAMRGGKDRKDASEDPLETLQSLSGASRDTGPEPPRT